MRSLLASLVLLVSGAVAHRQLQTITRHYRRKHANWMVTKGAHYLSASDLGRYQRLVTPAKPEVTVLT